jgi:ubiquitin-protein ligase
MTSGAHQLAADFDQVKEKLSYYNSIEIVATEGEPPESYDIEYKVKGYGLNSDGSPQPVESHRIRISLPFGYPHFPPTVKPLTPIFHPDIDPDAIRIADFWQEHHSLAELIVHIGQMICGTFYHKDEPFNQEALAWYEEKQDLLPFDTLEPTEAAEADLPGPESVEPAASPRGSLDILEEDLAFPFDEGEEVEIDLAGDTQGGDEEADLVLEPGGKDSPAGDEKGPVDLTLDDDDFELAFEEEDAAEDFSLELEDLVQDSGAPEEAGGDAGTELQSELPLGVQEETTGGGAEDQLSRDDTPITGEDTQTDIPLGDESGEEEIPLSTAGEGQPGQRDIPMEMETFTSGGSSEKEEGGADIEEDSLARLELDDDLPPEKPPEKTNGKARSIGPLVEKKKLFTAKRILTEIPDHGQIPDFDELERQITGGIDQAEELFKKADRLEQKGELEKAGLTLDQVANAAVDYPGLEFARNRIRDALLARDNDGGAQTPAREEIPAAGKGKTRKPAFRVPYRIIAVVLILLGILAAGAMVTVRDSTGIKNAYEKFRRAEQLLEQKEYKAAGEFLAAASAELDRIIVLGKDEKEKLYARIDAILDSQSFKEGLQGRVLYNGRYVTVEMARNIDRFNSLLLDAETQKNSGNIDEALRIYAQAEKAAAQLDFAEQEETIRLTINRLRLRQALGQARKAEEEREWKQAADTYAKALQLSKSFAADNAEDIATRLAAASFRHEVTEGQRAFTAAEWQKTIEMLQRALKILEANPQIASEAEQTEIRRLLINSRLYHILSGARAAFEKEEWELAVNQYKNAVYLLENNNEILGQKATEGIDKINKTILMTEIAREQSRNAAALAENDLQESLDSYRTIASLIDSSPYGGEETMQKILADARTRITDLENEIRINRRVEWLLQNYEEIFRKMYPSARSSELLNPQVSFVREEGASLLFNMSCVERKQGRSFRLELNYQYDQEKDRWDIYSGEL